MRLMSIVCIVIRRVMRYDCAIFGVRSKTDGQPGKISEISLLINEKKIARFVDVNRFNALKM